MLFQVCEIKRAERPFPLAVKSMEAPHDLEQDGALLFVERRDVEVGQALEQVPDGFDPVARQIAFR